MTGCHLYTPHRKMKWSDRQRHPTTKKVERPIDLPREFVELIGCYGCENLVVADFGIYGCYFCGARGRIG